MVRSAPGDVDRIRREVERALHGNIDAEEVLPLLAQLARAADPESEDWLYAHRHLAEIGVEHDPWRAALFARRVLAHRDTDDGAWAVLGLAQSLLGNFRVAARVYERALALSSENPWYAHNLGHLYDVALDRPADALPLLSSASEAQPDEADIAASYAHALARCGKVAAAKRLLKRAIRRGALPTRWLCGDGLTPVPPQIGWTVASRLPKRTTAGSRVAARIRRRRPKAILQAARKPSAAVRATAKATTM